MIEVHEKINKKYGMFFFVALFVLFALKSIHKIQCIKFTSKFLSRK